MVVGLTLLEGADETLMWCAYGGPEDADGGGVCTTDTWLVTRSFAQLSTMNQQKWPTLA